jgi:hypothetical protein
MVKDNLLEWVVKGRNPKVSELKGQMMLGEKLTLNANSAIS